MTDHLKCINNGMRKMIVTDLTENWLSNIVPFIIESIMDYYIDASGDRKPVVISNVYLQGTLFYIISGQRMREK